MCCTRHAWNTRSKSVLCKSCLNTYLCIMFY
nr:MAG TPA: hypothetical protein [Caudoviricetes sp.]